MLWGIQSVAPMLWASSHRTLRAFVCSGTSVLFFAGVGFDFYSMLRGLVVCSLLDSFLVEIEVSFPESTTEAEPECLFCLSLQLFHYRSGLIGYLADTSSKSPVEQLLWL